MKPMITSENKILIVDDDNTWLGTLSAWVTDAGLGPLSTQYGSKAIAHVQGDSNHKIKGAIIDWYLHKPENRGMFQDPSAKIMIGRIHRMRPDIAIVVVSEATERNAKSKEEAIKIYKEILATEGVSKAYTKLELQKQPKLFQEIIQYFLKGRSIEVFAPEKCTLWVGVLVGTDKFPKDLSSGLPLEKWLKAWKKHRIKEAQKKHRIRTSTKRAMWEEILEAIESELKSLQTQILEIPIDAIVIEYPSRRREPIKLPGKRGPRIIKFLAEKEEFPRKYLASSYPATGSCPENIHTGTCIKTTRDNICFQRHNKGICPWEYWEFVMKGQERKKTPSESEIKAAKALLAEEERSQKKGSSIKGIRRSRPLATQICRLNDEIAKLCKFGKSPLVLSNKVQPQYVCLMKLGFLVFPHPRTLSPSE